METDILSRMIRDKQATRSAVEAQLEPLLAQKQALDIEINVLQEALEKAQGKKSRVARNGGSRDRALQDHWIKTLRFIGERGTASLNDIHSYMKNNLGMETSEDTQRSQIATYVNKGLLERVSSGVYSLTDLGGAKSGFAKNSKAPEVGASDGGETPSGNSGETQNDDVTVDDVLS